MPERNVYYENSCMTSWSAEIRSLSGWLGFGFWFCFVFFLQAEEYGNEI